MRLLRTFKELSLHPYPDNVRLGCFYWAATGESDDSFTTVASGWLTDDGDKYTLANNLEGWHWPCQVLERNSANNTYTVQIFQSPSADDTKWHQAGEDRIVKNFPRNSIQFFPQKRSSDQHLRAVFRQPIGLADSMVPSLWRYDRYAK